MIALNTIKHEFEQSNDFKFGQNKELRANVSVLPEIRLRQDESSALHATFRSYHSSLQVNSNGIFILYNYS